MDITWEEPPSTSGRGALVREEEVPVIQALRDHPGQWARIYEFDKSGKVKAANIATSIRKGQRAGWQNTPDGRFDAAMRTVHGAARVYVRYVPTA